MTCYNKELNRLSSGFKIFLIKRLIFADFSHFFTSKTKWGWKAFRLSLTFFLQLNLLFKYSWSLFCFSLATDPVSNGFFSPDSGFERRRILLLIIAALHTFVAYFSSFTARNGRILHDISDADSHLNFLISFEHLNEVYRRCFP